MVSQNNKQIVKELLVSISNHAIELEQSAYELKVFTTDKAPEFSKLASVLYERVTLYGNVNTLTLIENTEKEVDTNS